MSGRWKAVTAGWILSGENLTRYRNGIVLVEDDVIVDIIPRYEMDSIKDRADVIDLGGTTIMPGIFDCHDHLAMDAGTRGHLAMMHLPEEEHWITALAGLKKNLHAGVTTARCMGDRYYLDVTMKKKIASGETEGPALLVCGIGMRSRAGHGYVGLPHTGAEQFRKTSEDNISRGVDHLKIFVSPGIPAASQEEEIPCFLTAEEIAAVTQASDRAGIYTAAHCIGGPGLELCVLNGVKVLEHLYSITPGQIHFLEEQFGGWIDLTSGIVMDEGREAFTPQAQNIKMRRARPYAEECLARLCESRYLRFTLGTDAYHGMLWKEVEYAVKCGMDRKEALKAITVNAAAMTGTGKMKGQISPGYQADLIAVGSNPLRCPEALADVRFVMHKGKVVKKNGSA